MTYCALAAACLTMAGCRVTKESRTDYEYTATGYATKTTERDTTLVSERTEEVRTDSSLTETERDTEVTFAPGGGSYNVVTGQMDGVISVRLSEREKELRKTIDSLVARLDEVSYSVTETADSSYAASGTVHEETYSKTEAQNFWWIWFTIGLVVGAGGVIALKKFPVTSPFMFWL